MKAGKSLWSPALLIVVLSIVSAGCNSTPNPVRSYNGTASVGDFLTISIDSKALTISYNNLTNGESGIAKYTVNSDKSYTITDPNGNLLAAYEIPGDVLVIKAVNAGPNRDEPALITAIESVPVTVKTFEGRSYNYMEFRTNNGGVEIGTGTVDNSGNTTSSYYDPGAIMWTPTISFGGGSAPAPNWQEDPSGRFLTFTDQSKNEVITMFGTQDGLFAMDGDSGAVIGLPQAANKDFDSSVAGTYNAIYYEKVDAQMQNNVEVGTPAQGEAIITVDTGGKVKIIDSQTKVEMASGTLKAIADVPTIYDGTSNELSDPCYGMFTFETSGSVLQDVFVTFQGDAVIFSSFQAALPVQNNGTYTYFYGVGLK